MFHFTPTQTCPKRRRDAGCFSCTVPGLFAGTALRTRDGFKFAGEITWEDEIAVFPHGFLRPKNISRRIVFDTPQECPFVAQPVMIPAGALGIHDDVLLQHDARVLISDPGLRPVLGTPHVSIAASDLVGFRDIGLVRPATDELVTFAFEQDEFISVDDGLRVLAPAAQVGLDALTSDTPRRQRVGGARVVALSSEHADFYLASLEAELMRQTADLLGHDPG